MDLHLDGDGGRLHIMSQYNEQNGTLKKPQCIRIVEVWNHLTCGLKTLCLQVSTVIFVLQVGHLVNL